MFERRVATFDIGGTNIRAATVAVTSDSHWLLNRTKRSTPNYMRQPDVPASKLLEDVLAFVVDYATHARQMYGVDAVSAAFPGPVRGGSVLMALPTVWGPDGASLCPLDLGGRLHERLPDMEVRVMNDVSAAGYRYVARGVDFAIFTLGSGVGLKVFINGTPCVGPSGRGGELTHMVFDQRDDAPTCDCGGRGHLGALVSGRAWERLVEDCRQAGSEPDLDAFTEPLARAVAMLHFSLGLERFVLAGGLAEGLGETLRLSVINNLPTQGWNLGQRWDEMVLLAPADDSHALIGGALSLRV
jgi:glucokinase